MVVIGEGGQGAKGQRGNYGGGNYGGNRGICYKFRDGRDCTFGSSCKFLHDDGDGDDGIDNFYNGDGMSSLSIRGGGGGGGGVCYNWRDNGSCRFNQDCKFVHGDAGGSQNICYNWKDNKACQFGDNCKFIHKDDVDDYGGYKPRSNRSGGGSCNNFRNTGKCRFAENCKFTHDGEQATPIEAQ